jgi:hypothetical protein
MYLTQLMHPAGRAGMQVRMDAPSRIPAVATSGQSERATAPILAG